MPLQKEFLVERQGRQFALYAGLLDLAHQEGLRAITTELVQPPTDGNGQTAVCRAVVVTEKGTFTGLGDASPTNVTRQMLPHLLRLAETRAKARALRDAVNVGVAAVEELGELGPDGSGEDASAASGARPRRLAAPSQFTPGAQSGAQTWPAAAQATPAADGAATEPQYRLLRELAARLGGRDVPDGLTRGRASELIDRWKAEAPRP
jgi:hypothetical protein